MQELYTALLPVLAMLLGGAVVSCWQGRMRMSRRRWLPIRVRIVRRLTKPAKTRHHP